MMRIKMAKCSVAVMMVLGLGEMAGASTVSFKVLGGYFDGNTSLTTLQMKNGGESKASLAFLAGTGTQTWANVSAGTTLKMASLGTFNLTASGENAFTVPTGTTFTLSIQVFDPFKLSGSSIASVTGKVQRGSASKDIAISLPDLKLDGGNTGAGTLLFNFNDVTFSAVSGESTGALGGTLNYDAGVVAQRDAQSVPLPAAGLGGVALMMVGGLTRRRRN